ATWVRNYEMPVTSCGSSDRRWPALDCGDEKHCVGETFAGFVWDLRKNLVASLGEVAGITTAEHVVFAGLMAGASSIPTTVRAIFTEDDDDGRLLSGTPHFSDLFEAGRAHGFGPKDPFGLPCLFTATPDVLDSDAGGTVVLELDTQAVSIP